MLSLLVACPASFAQRGARATPARGPRVSVDLLISRGRVVDGSGADPRVLDVGIRGDRIVFVGDAASARVRAARTIRAAGLVVAPGFIDPHTHTLEDLSSPARRGNENYLMQGVTTVFTGNDGGGPFRVAETLASWRRGGLGTNAALLVGHGTVRRHVLGMSDAAPTPEQLARMKELVGRAMAEGAFGISTGLYYAPGSFARTEEVIELSRVAAAAGGIYDTHMRDENSYSVGLLGSIEETIRIGREAGIPVHISHIKALGKEVWGRSADAIRLIRAARDSGVEVTADQYPYAASGTSITAALVPRWAEEGGAEGLRRRIEDPSVRPRLVADMEANLRRRGGARSLLITSARDRAVVGKTLEEVAKARGVSAVEAAIEIAKQGGAALASFNMSEADIEYFMAQDFVATGSDGSTGHPRKYGTFPRKLREYVYNKKLLTLQAAVRAGGALTAEWFRLPGRGLLREGYFADLIVFDEATVADRATYERPELLAVGMRYVVVNGRVVVEEGKYNGALAGRPLSKR